jgi:preprotein translocase subunit SecG
MESVLLVLHVIVALLIVGLIMLQQGKGAEMGASFGAGGSQTVFGAAGTGNLFSRLTAILVAVFFVTSFVLAMLAKNSVGVDDSMIPYMEETAAEAVPSVTSDVSSAPADSSAVMGDSMDSVPVVDDERDAAVSDEGDVPESE